MSNERAQIKTTTESEHPDLVVAQVDGSLNYEGLSEVRNVEHAFEKSVFARKLLLNLSNCKLLDSTGVSWLIQLHRRFEKEKGQLVLHSVPRALLADLKILHLETVLNISNDEKAARDFIRNG